MATATFPKKSNGTRPDDYDPELEAEKDFAKLCLENGIAVPKSTASVTQNGDSSGEAKARGGALSRTRSGSKSSKGGYTSGGADDEASTHSGDTSSTGGGNAPSARQSSLKVSKSERKKRQRGVSGSSIKKDGGRFDMGIDARDYSDFEDYDDEEDDYGDYAQYVTDRHSGPLADNDSDCGSSEGAIAPHTPPIVSGKMGSLMTRQPGLSDVLNALVEATRSDGCDGALVKLAEALSETADESARARLLRLAISSLLQNATDLSAKDPKIELHLLRVLVRLVEQGFLAKESLLSAIDTCPNASGNDDEVRPYLETAVRWISTGEAKRDWSGVEKNVAAIASQFVSDYDCDTVIGEFRSLNAMHLVSRFVFHVLAAAVGSMSMDTLFYTSKGFRELFDKKFLSRVSLAVGWTSFLTDLSDFSVDVPAAASMVNLFASYAYRDHKLFSQRLFAMCPRPNRRLVRRHDSVGRLSVCELGGAEVDNTNYLVVDDDDDDDDDDKKSEGVVTDEH